jgi:hypothetical protein
MNTGVNAQDATAGAAAEPFPNAEMCTTGM